MASDVQEYLAKMSKGECPNPGTGATPEEVVAAAKEAGYTFTVEDLAGHAASDDNDLDSAGGGCNFNMGNINA